MPVDRLAVSGEISLLDVRSDDRRANRRSACSFLSPCPSREDVKCEVRGLKAPRDNKSGPFCYSITPCSSRMSMYLAFIVLDLLIPLSDAGQNVRRD
jgi:hypothetical protein